MTRARRVVPGLAAAGVLTASIVVRATAPVSIEPPLRDARDQTPPVVTALVQRPYLFLPRNAMLDVLLQRTVMDLCDPMPVVTVEVWSNQPDTGAPFTPDAAVVGPALQVRAEVDLASLDPGRVMLVVVAATDMSGNVGRDCTWAIVPKTVTVTHLVGTRTVAQAAEVGCDVGGVIPGGWFNVLPPTPLP